jgi:hypothetical protein
MRDTPSLQESKRLLVGHQEPDEESPAKMRAARRRERDMRLHGDHGSESDSAQKPGTCGSQELDSELPVNDESEHETAGARKALHVETEDPADHESELEIPGKPAASSQRVQDPELPVDHESEHEMPGARKASHVEPEESVDHESEHEMPGARKASHVEPEESVDHESKHEMPGARKASHVETEDPADHESELEIPGKPAASSQRVQDPELPVDHESEHEMPGARGASKVETEDPAIQEVIPVERLLKKQWSGKVLWLKVKWVGISTGSWEKADHMRNELGDEDYQELLETLPKKRGRGRQSGEELCNQNV